MFGLSIAHPVVLAVGAGAAAVPVLIHLLHRQRADVHRFAAIDLLLRTQKRLATRMRLQQLILLALRVLAVGCVAAGLARPFLAARAPAAAGAAPVSSVFVLDDSLSMQYRRAGESAFDRAAAAARRAVDALRRGDNAAVLAASEGRRPAMRALTFDQAALRRRLRALRVGFGAWGVQPALEAACELLAASSLPRKRVVLFHDLARAAWGVDALPALRRRLEEAGAALEIVDVRGPGPRPNAAVLSVRTRRDRASGELVVSARVAAARKRTPVDVVLGREIAAQGFADPSPRGAADKTFRLAPRADWPSAGRVEVRDDALPGDNARWFALTATRRIRALLVDGEPGTTAYENETFYLERAWQPGPDSDSPVRVSVAAPAELPGRRLAAFDLVALCNVGDWPPGAADAVRRYVAGGGRLLVTLGDRAAAGSALASLRPLLPAGLRGVKTSAARPFRFDLAALGHPVAQAALAVKRSDAADVRFRRVALLDGRLAPGTEVVLRYDNGLPALLVRWVGRGAVALLTTTIDRDWTDLPIRTVFVPLMHELARYLEPGAGASGAATLVGRPMSLRLPRRVAAACVIGPEGDVEPLTLAPGGWAKTAVAARTLRPGLYVVKAGRPGDSLAKAETLSEFVVNTDPKESDLTPIDPAALERALGPGRAAIAAADAAAGLAAPREVSFAFLTAAFLLLTLEALVAIRE